LEARSGHGVLLLIHGLWFHPSVWTPWLDELDKAGYEASNLPRYPKLHAWLRDSRVPVLAVWGRNDEIFGPEGARAFAADAPGTELHLLDGGHFLLESALATAAAYIRGFLGKTLP